MWTNQSGNSILQPYFFKVLSPAGNYFVIQHQLRHPEWILAKSRARLLLIQIKGMGIRLLLFSDHGAEVLALDEIQFTRKLNSQQAIEQLQAFVPSSLMSEADPVKVVMALDSEIFTLCPKILFEENGKSQLLTTLGNLPAEAIVLAQEQPDTDFLVVHAIPNEWNLWTNQVFSSSEAHWISALNGLIFKIRNWSAGSSQPLVFAHIESGHLYIIAASQGKILLVNRFTYQAENDLLYFLLLITKELNFSPEMVRLILAGQILSGSLGFEKLDRYFGKMEFAKAEPTFSIPYGLDLLHHHQYLDIISIADFLSSI